MVKKNKKPNTSKSSAATKASDSSSGIANAGRYVAISLLILGAGVFLYASLGERGSGVSTTNPPMASVELQRVQTTPGAKKRFRYHDSEEAARAVSKTKASRIAIGLPKTSLECSRSNPAYAAATMLRTITQAFLTASSTSTPRPVSFA